MIKEFKEKLEKQEMQEMVEMAEISKEFKVFRDPTFNDFIKIVGTKANEDLPLFAQLYILKEILQFY